MICPVRIYMPAVFNIKSAVIMLGIVSAVFSCSAVMPCQFHLIAIFPLSFQCPSNGKILSPLPAGDRAFPFIFSQSGAWEKGSFAASPADFSVRQYTQYEVTQASLLWAMAAALDLLRWLRPLNSAHKKITLIFLS